MARRSTSFLLIAGLAALCSSAGYAQQPAEIARPVLRPSVTVNSDLVLIGDMVENAGAAAGIAIYRAPDIGIIVNQINDGQAGFKIYHYFSKKYNKNCFSVNWVDIPKAEQQIFFDEQ